MRTKNFFLIAAFIICGLVCVNSVNAQDQKSDQVTVNIKLNPIQAIVVNPATDHQTVDLVYDGIDDYENGVTKELLEHLTVYSAGKFVVSVNTNGNFVGPGKTIDAGDVNVTATTADGEVVNSTPVKLSTEAKPLITSNSEGGKGLKFKYNITYNNEGGKDSKYASAEYYTAADGVQTYTATVTYTIAAD